MNGVLFDANPFLDVTLERAGLYEGSAQAFAKCQTLGLKVWVAWHTLSNIFYILGRSKGVPDRHKVLRGILNLSIVAPVRHADARRALTYSMSDFEDALQLSAAEACGASIIVTRDKGDFTHPTNIRILTPEEFVEDML